MTARVSASPARLALRAATTDPLLSLLAILIVAGLAFVAASAPGLLQSVQTATVRHALHADNAAVLDVTMSVRGAPTPGSGTSAAARALPPELQPLWGSVLDELTSERELMDPALRAIVGGPRAVATLDGACSVPCPLPDASPTMKLFVSFDPDVSNRIRFVEGVAPVVTGDPAPLQIALAASVASELQWKVGDSRTVDYRPGTLIVQLTGTFEPIDAADGEWRHVPTGITPDIIPGGLGKPTVVGTGYAPAAELQRAVGLARVASTTVWFPFEVDKVDAGATEAIDAAVRKFSSQPRGLSVVGIDQQFAADKSYRSVAPVTLGVAGLRTAATAAIVAVVASGPIAVAVVVLALAARMIAMRRRTSVRLAVARGASRRQLALLLGVEGLALGVIGAVPAVVAAILLFHGRGALAVLGPVLAALTPAVALPVLGLTVARRGRSDLGLQTPGRRRWRLGGELALVAVTVAATLVVATRAPGEAWAAADPTVTALPLLLAAVGCVLVLRLVPVVLSVVERALAGGRGLLALLGPARARRDPAIRVAPVLAVVVGVAIAIFSVGFLATVQDGIRVSSHSSVGADLRVEAGYLGPDQLAAMRTLDGVASVAPVYASQQTQGDLPSGDIPVTVYVIDVAELRAVQRDGDTRIGLPAALLATDGDSVPVIASNALAARVGGDSLALDDQAVDIVGSAATVTPLGAARNWVAVDRANADRLVTNPNSPSVALIDLVPGTSAAGVIAEVRTLVPSATASTPASVAAALRDDPALTGVQNALLIAIGLVALFLALALAMSLVLGGPARGRLISLLGALGFRRSQEPALVVWEVAPAVGLALPIGAAIGLALPFLVVGAVDLTPFVGGDGQPAIRLGGWTPLLVAGGFVVLTALCVLIAAAVAGRVSAARTLRTIDEEG